VGIDGDSDSWELQRLAEFGKLTQIPPLFYGNVNAARRALYARCWDSGKIIIATNKVKADYEDKLDEEGNPVIDEKSGKPVQVKSKNVKRQGFQDQDYLWQIQLRHLFKPAEEKEITGGPRAGQIIKTSPQWGIRILKAKANPMVEGEELWGDQCNFSGLVQLVYPQVPLELWGYR